MADLCWMLLLENISEQNRDDNYKDGDARVYKFSKNSKYFYAFPFNAFLNIGYRF